MRRARVFVGNCGCAIFRTSNGNRSDNVYGDRNLFCACIPVEEFA